MGSIFTISECNCLKNPSIKNQIVQKNDEIKKLKERIEVLLNDNNKKTFELNEKFLDTTFGELRVANRTNLIDIKSIFGISDLRDDVITSNGGTITNQIGVDSEYELVTTTDPLSNAKLQTKTKGRYVAGIEAEVGIAIRVCTNIPIGNGFNMWGYYDDKDGYGFIYNKDGLSIFIRKGGVDNIIHSNNFNVNNDLTNLNNNGISINFSKGNIYNIAISWYGYGDIIYIININNIRYVLHKYTVTSGTSCNNPILPLTIEVNNNNSPEALDLCVAGRQFSHMGSYNPMFRLTPIIVIGKTIPVTNSGSTDNYTPIISIRKKLNNRAAPLLIDSIEVLTDYDCIVTIFSNTTLDGNENYGNIPNISESETLIEYDSSASDFTGSGIVLMSSLILGGGRKNKNTLTASKLRGIDLSTNSNITLCAKSIDSSATMDILFNIKEEF